MSTRSGQSWGHHEGEKDNILTDTYTGVLMFFCRTIFVEFNMVLQLNHPVEQPFAGPQSRVQRDPPRVEGMGSSNLATAGLNIPSCNTSQVT